MKKNRQHFTRSKDPISPANSPSSIRGNFFHRLGTWELVSLVSIPVAAALLFHQQAHQVPRPMKAVPVTQTDYQPSPIVEKVLPPPLMEAVRVDPGTRANLPAVAVKVTEPVHEAATIPADLAEEIRIEKEAIENWGEALVAWNIEANQKVKESMERYRIEDTKIPEKTHRYIGRMIYAFQNPVNDSGQRARAASANESGSAGSGRRPTSVDLISHQDIDAKSPYAQSTPGRPQKSGGVCAPNPPANFDRSCRANYPCRICGGCCCATEARLARLGF